MSTKSATEYAESVAQGIWDNYNAGHPFGYDKEREEYGEDAELSAYDYLEDALDIEYRVSGTREYRSAKILISFGGPNAWIDTHTRQLIVAWWSAPVVQDLPQQFCDELDSAISQFWGSN